MLYPELNPYQSKDSVQKILNCQGCNTVFAKQFATPIATPCGHFFCLEKCEQYLKSTQTCLVCAKSIQIGSLIRQKKAFADKLAYNENFKYGQNKYLVSILHPERLILMKKEMDGSALLKDFIKEFVSLDAYLNDPKYDFYLVITQKQARYNDVKNKSFDELKNFYSLVTVSENSYRVNKMMVRNGYDGGKQEASSLQMQY